MNLQGYRGHAWKADDSLVPQYLVIIDHPLNHNIADRVTAIKSFVAMI